MKKHLPFIIHRLSFLLILILTITNIRAQQYPVQGGFTIVGATPAYLSDLANPSLDKLILNLTLTDLTLTNKRVKLRLYIQKQNTLIAQSVDYIAGEPTIFLEGGIPQRFTGMELATYFRLENLQGMNPDAYSHPLPEGLYNIGFEVYDYFTGNKLSAALSNVSFILLNDPPLLNMPRNRENLPEFLSPTGENMGSSQIIFQWTPRTTQVSNTEYEFTLSQILDEGGDPYQQFFTAIPTYQTTTTSTTLRYGLTEPPLLAGRTYAWRVQAKAKVGFEDIGLYRQNGYSEIYLFKYGGQCAPLQNINIEVKSYDRLYITWNAAAQPPKGSMPVYKIAVRKYSTTHSWEWSEFETSNPYFNLSRLEANTEYEIKAGTVCPSAVSGYTVSYSLPQIKRTLPDGEINGLNCGQPPPLIYLSNKKLIENLYVNDVVMAADFPVTITKVKGNKNGWSGEGWVHMKWLNDTKLRVVYSRIKVNTDYRLIDGFFETPDKTSEKNIVDLDSFIVDVKGFIKDVRDLFIQDADGQTGVQKVINEISKTSISDKEWNDVKTDIQQTIIHTVQPPVNSFAQQELNKMDSARQQYENARQQLDSSGTIEQKQTAQQRMDSAKASYTAAQQQLTESLQVAAELLKYKFPDKEWFTAIETYLTKYTGMQADKSLAQYYWRKQTDSAYALVLNAYNLPDSLKQSLTKAYNNANPAWAGLEEGKTAFHKTMGHVSSLATYSNWSEFYGGKFIEDVQALKEQLRLAVEWSNKYGIKLIVIQKTLGDDGKKIMIQRTDCSNFTTLTEYNDFKKNLWCTYQLYKEQSPILKWKAGYAEYTQGGWKDGSDCNGTNSSAFRGTHTGGLVLDFTQPVINACYYENEITAETEGNKKNVLLFVNGYRNNIGVFENSDSKDDIRVTPIDNYWGDMDDQFIMSLKDRKVVYADGHFTVGTSNHKNRRSFLGSMATSKSVRNEAGNPCFHNNRCVHLNTTPNAEGFNYRKTHGKLAAQTLEKELNDLKFDKKTEKIDIVAHSMGYAYALGMIEYLQGKGYTMGRFYIIAPENACSGGTDWNKFEEVWQYGSDLDRPDKENRDPLWLQDGVAPQCEVDGFKNPNIQIPHGRAYIPKEIPNLQKGFTESHSIEGYEWIFNREINQSGYVKPR